MFALTRFLFTFQRHFLVLFLDVYFKEKKKKAKNKGQGTTHCLQWGKRTSDLCMTNTRRANWKSPNKSMGHITWNNVHLLCEERFTFNYAFFHLLISKAVHKKWFFSRKYPFIVHLCSLALPQRSKLSKYNLLKINLLNILQTYCTKLIIRKYSQYV